MAGLNFWTCEPVYPNQWRGIIKNNNFFTLVSSHTPKFRRSVFVREGQHRVSQNSMLPSSTRLPRLFHLPEPPPATLATHRTTTRTTQSSAMHKKMMVAQSRGARRGIGSAMAMLCSCWSLYFCVTQMLWFQTPLSCGDTQLPLFQIRVLDR